MNKAVVNVNVLNVRSGSGTSYPVITQLIKSTEVEVIEVALNGWKKIKTSEGVVGWVNGSYLTIVKEKQLQIPNKVQAVIDLAFKQLGKPYVWGDEGPNSFDCSGLMYYVFKNAANIILPRTSSAQYNIGVGVSKSNLQAGDLIFFTTDGTGKITHVAMYIGDSKMIHAPHTGKNVEIANMNTNFWNKAYIGARRVLL